jgi:hypothetical protein
MQQSAPYSEHAPQNPQPTRNMISSVATKPPTSKTAPAARRCPNDGAQMD